MSYTMTLDMPQKEAAYVARHRAQFQSELNAIALVIVQSRMQPTREESLTAADFLERLRGDGPFLDDEEMHVFDRVKDYGRPIDLA